ncbi:mobile mystery protein A [uncultured Devosia sp.]|uniref:mobile mystery protein A n=1 Tax=uncultured Devosia sp. TaxID=211434 RepID=UPI0035CB03F3
MAWNAKLKKARTRLDARLDALKPASHFQPPAKGWIRALRDALGLSSVQLGKLLGVRSQSIDDMEKSEANGTIRLETLRRAAQALDCTLVYALVPNTSLNEIVAFRAHVIAAQAMANVSHTMALENQGVSADSRTEIIQDYIRDHISERDLWLDA